MITTNLRTNQLSPEAYGWYLGYLAARDIDATQSTLPTA
jgi:hypothetical protein